VGQLDDILRIASSELPAGGVECLLIGGFAVNYYGYTRNTVDVDFMIVSEDIENVKTILRAAGFTDSDVRENVAFFNKPEGGPRVDFLRIDRGTMAKLSSRAVPVSIHGHPLRIPALPDLIAMKIFAFAQSPERRLGKDLPDIAYLSVLNHLDFDADIRPLCDKFGSPRVCAMIREQMEGLRSS